MFRMGIQEKGCGKKALVCDFHVDTLPEAEALAFGVAMVCFPDKNITFRYEEDEKESSLIYKIYEDGISEHIGRVGIKSLLEEVKDE